MFAATLLLSLLEKLTALKTFAAVKAGISMIPSRGYTLHSFNHDVNHNLVRARIARDLHDNIGSTLGSISYYSEMARHLPEEKKSQRNMLLKKIEEASHDLIEEMSDMVWAINPVNDSLEKLTTRMRNYGTDFLSTCNIDYSFETKIISDIPQLSIEQRKNIFLIYKEAIYNASKYSACSRLTASIIQSTNNLIIEVRDNGKGFDINQPAPYNGNGIINMKYRAKEIGAEFYIFSEKGKGTQVCVLIPVEPEKCNPQNKNQDLMIDT
ncbi:MAG: hypothetical protein H0W62_04350 [Chitinophagales bacterium]|nr:hypothetical protein [Chitinophagales bacterium]